MARPCPICKKAVMPGTKEFPFCSDRCRWLDLGAWLDGDYRVPVAGPSGEDDDGDAAGEEDIEESSGEEPPPGPRGGR